MVPAAVFWLVVGAVFCAIGAWKLPPRKPPKSRYVIPPD